MDDYAVTTVAVSVHLATDHPMYGESVTDIRVVSEFSGSYVVMSQSGRTPVADIEPGALAFWRDELPVVMAAAMRLLEGLPADTDPAPTTEEPSHAG